MIGWILVGLLLACVEPGPETHGIAGEALGTTWSVKWLGASRHEEVREVTERLLEEIDRSMSTYRDDSDLARIRAVDGPVVVEADTALVVREAMALADATGGAFDPTVQPLVELWGFRGARRRDLPTEEELNTARALVGWEKVEVGYDEEGQAWVNGGGTALDLSAIAKGHAVDRVSQGLSRLRLPDHMVEVGGEVRAQGGGPAGEGWRLGIDVPEEGLAPGERLAAVVELVNGAVATSGNYRQSYLVDTLRVTHILDPRTGRPLPTRVGSATVVAPDCSTADGWATALMVLGPEEGLPLIERQPFIEAMLLVSTQQGWTAVQTSGMDDVLLRGP